MEEIDIVIIGGGIAGLATSLALHRKGIKSVVLEKSQSLRTTGVAIGIHTNGWRALDQLGVADKLRQTALPLQLARAILVENGKQREIVTPVSAGEARCVKRNDLLQALADDLPRGTIRFGCQTTSVNLDTSTSYPIIQLQDGRKIHAKVLIGCDGAFSVVGDFLGLKPTKLFSSCAVRGFTRYPEGHRFPSELVRIKKGNVLFGRIPMSNEVVYFFAVLQPNCKEANDTKDPEAIAQMTLEAVNEFPEEWKGMIKNSDLSSLSVAHLRYRSPWDILQGKFRRGTATVAGDAMHVMGPFLGQGGCAGIEDAVVLGRSLAQKIGHDGIRNEGMKEICEALDEYVKERRMRLVRLSTQSYLTGTVIETSSHLLRLIIIVCLFVLFRNQIGHARYDCGRL